MRRVTSRPQQSHRRFEHRVSGSLEELSLKWDPAEEVIQVKEYLQWLKSPNDCLPSLEEMEPWLQMGRKKLVIEDEIQFCDEDVVINLLRTKNILNNLDERKIRYIRARCNPYETIRSAIFLNRSAVKMANIDKVCDFIFTRPEGLQDNELLYFADVCGGPGGFSEYVFWRKKWLAKGFGLTLKNEEDFKLDDFHAGPSETFHPCYGPKNNGDVFDPSNQEAFKELIMKHTHGKGVHFMMADGAFSVEGQENIQEILSKQLYLCQCLVALMIVREKGHFVTNLFDVLTPVSAGIVYLMYRCFEEICIFKPNSSRPASSERFLICKSKRPGTEDVVRYLKNVNNLLLKKDDNNDVLQLVSFDKLKKENQFLRYLRTSNEHIAKQQIIGIRKIVAFYNNNTLVERKQNYVRKECLKYWEIPDGSRIILKNRKPEDNLKDFLGDNNNNFVLTVLNKLTTEEIKNTILIEPHDWFCMPCSTVLHIDSSRNATFYIGMGRSNVYRLVRGTWVHVDDIFIELPPDTLVYAEVVCEMTKESKHQHRVLVLHIIDAFVLGGQNISRKCFKERYELAKQCCEALWKPDESVYNRVLVKELLPVDPNICETLLVKQRMMSNNRPDFAHELPATPLNCSGSDSDKPYFTMNSVIFLKNTPVDLKTGKDRAIWYPFDTTLNTENVTQLIEEKWFI